MRYKEELSKTLFKHCSQRHSNLQTVIELIKQGADVNFIEDGETCLYNICCKFNEKKQHKYFDGNLSILKILLEYGADPNVKITTPEDHLFEYPENGFPCFFALFSSLLSPHKNLVTAMELLIKFGANLNVQDKLGNTLVDRICYSFQDKAVLFKSLMELLIKHKAELKANKMFRSDLLKLAIQQDISPLGLSMIMQEGIDENELALRQMEKKYNMKLSPVKSDFYKQAKQDGHLIEKLLFCVTEHDNPKTVFEFMKNLCERANRLFPHRNHIKPQEKKGVLTFLKCLKEKKFRVPNYIIYQILNENVNVSAEEIIEDTLKQFNASSPSLKRI